MLPPHLHPRDRITIELHEIGPDDGRRVGADARTLLLEYVRPQRCAPSVADYVTDAWRSTDEAAYRRVRFEWDGSQTPDGAYRFRRKTPT